MADDYFDKPAIALPDDALIVVACGRNERARLPFWLDYYRSHGVDAFFFADNASDDGTTEYLREQGDVHLFWTDGSYVESKSGRLWTTELARHYGMNRWVLTLDADEQLVFPGSERVTIKELTRYLDLNDYQGLFCFFLDMYGPGALSEAVYEPGTPFLQTCQWFDGEGYTLRRSQRFPFLQISGGPRQRIFWKDGGAGSGPAMRKIPLVKWHEGMDYIFSTHSLTPLRLADVSGALLHFKFFASFTALAAAEAVRGDRTQAKDYARYAQIIAQEDALTFRSEISQRYTRSVDLLKVGYMTATEDFVRFAEGSVRSVYGNEAAQVFRGEYDLADVGEAPAGGLLDRVWLFVADAFRAGNLTSGPAARPHVAFEHIAPHRIMGGLDMADGHADRQKIDVELLADGEMVAETKARRLKGARKGVLRFEFQPSEGKSFRKGAYDVRLAGEANGLLESPIVVAFGGSGKPERAELDGAVELADRYEVRGWAMDRRDLGREIEIEVRSGGRAVAQGKAGSMRADLLRLGIGNGRHGFAIKVPEDALGEDRTVRVRFKETGKQIPGSPCRLDKDGSCGAIESIMTDADEDWTGEG